MLHPGCKQALPALDSHLTHLLKGQSALVLSLTEKKKRFLEKFTFLNAESRIPTQTYFRTPHTFSLAFFIFYSILSNAAGKSG